MSEALLAIGITVGTVLVFGLAAVASLYRRCPSNKILAVYGTGVGGRSAKCIHGGGTFVWPLIQGSQFMSLEPMAIDIPLTGALSKQNIRINAPSAFTVGISTDPAIMANAAERLLGLQDNEIVKQAEDIIIGQLRLVVATMDIEEINQDREKFLEAIHKNVALELNKIGLQLINVNIKDITDESGYIEAIGRKAAAEAVNRAKVEVAEQEKLGAIGEARAKREREIEVASEVAEAEKGRKEAEKGKRVTVAQLEAEALTGESEAKVIEARATREMEVRIANEIAQGDQGKKEAEAQKRIAVSEFEANAIAGENEQAARVAATNAELHQEQAQARERGEVARARAEQAILEAAKAAEVARLRKEELAQREVEKLKAEVDAEAEAEKRRRVASGEADATRARFDAEADGTKALLLAKTEGYRSMIEACHGDSQAAATLLLLEKLEELVGLQAEAISKMQIDKITVWDSGGGGDESTTARFVNGLATSLPPLHELAKQAGLELPEYLGRIQKELGDDSDDNVRPAAAKSG